MSYIFFICIIDTVKTTFNIFSNFYGNKGRVKWTLSEWNRLIRVQIGATVFEKVEDWDDKEKKPR